MNSCIHSRAFIVCCIALRHYIYTKHNDIIMLCGRLIRRAIVAHKHNGVILPFRLAKHHLQYKHHHHFPPPATISNNSSIAYARRSFYSVFSIDSLALVNQLATFAADTQATTVNSHENTENTTDSIKRNILII